MSEFLFDDSSNLLPEEDWQDTYSLGPKLGKGRSGVVRLAENVHTGELLACKSISKEKLLKVGRRAAHPGVTSITCGQSRLPPARRSKFGRAATRGRLMSGS